MFLPNQYNNQNKNIQEVREQSAISTVAKTALSFVAYGLGLKAFKGLAFRANVGLGKLVTQLATPKSAASQAIAKGIKSANLGADTAKNLTARLHAGAIGIRKSIARINTGLSEALDPLVKEGRYSAGVMKYANKLNTKVGDGTLGRFAVNKSGQVKDIRFTTILRNTDRFRRSGLGQFSNKIMRDINVARQNPNIGTLSLLRGASKLTAREAGSVIRGRIYSYATNMASIAAFDYAAYNITNPESTKKWYNPTKIAEWAAFSIGSDLAMRGGIDRAKGVTSFMYKGLKTALKTNDVGKKFISSVLSRAQRISSDINTVAASRTFDVLEGLHNKASNPASQLMRNISGFQKEFTKIKNDLIDTQKTGKSPLYSGKSFIDETLDHLKSIDETTNDRSKAASIKKAHLDQVREQQAKRDPNKWIERVNDLFGTNLKSTRADIEHGSERVKDVYLGHGFFEDGKRQYQLPNLMPKKMLSNTFKFLNDNFSIGITEGIRFRPLSIFGLKPLIAGAENTFSLYTSKDTGAVDILVPYDLRKVRNKLDTIKHNSDAMQLVRREFKDNPETSFIKELDTRLEQFRNGSLGKNGTPEEREMYSAVNKLSRDTQDLDHANEFVSTYLDAHDTLFRANKMSEDKGIHRSLLEKGILKLDLDNEYVIQSGNTMIYGIKDGKNWKTFNLGYDVDKSAYHQILSIPGASAEGLKGISAATRGIGDVEYVDADGNMKRVRTGFGIPKTQMELSENAGPLRRFVSITKNKLEVANKSEKSVFEMFGDYVTKFLHPKQFRTIQHMSAQDPKGFVDRIAHAHGDMHTFLSRYQTIAKEMNTAMTTKVISQHSFIDEMGRISKTFEQGDGSAYKRTFDLYAQGDVFINESLSATGNYTQINSDIKERTKKLINATEDVINGNHTEYRSNAISAMTNNDIDFLQQVVQHHDPIKFLGYLANKSEKITNREMYNNLVFRTYYNALSHQKQGDLIKTLQSSSKLQELRKDLNILEMSEIINTYNNIDINKVQQMSETLMEQLGEKTINNLSQHKAAASRLVDIIEPIWAPSRLHDNLLYPSPQYQPLNVAISLNRDLHDPTQAIYSFGEQLTRQTTDIWGHKTGTVQTTTSIQMSQALNAINNTGNIIGLGFNQDAISTVGEFSKRLLFKRVLPAMAIGVAYNATDAFLDNSELFDGTNFGEGISPLFANALGQSRLALAGVNDKIGITATAKYLEDLMPGSVSSPLSNTVRAVGGPMAGMGLGFKLGGPVGGLVGGSIGAAMGLMTSGGPAGIIGKFDLSKSRAELIEEYSGRREIPIHTGAGWLFGMGPVMGRNINRYEPSWYAKTMSQYKFTNVLYGSKSERLLAPLDADHYFEKHMVTRPYPVTENALSHTPILGGVIGFGGELANKEELKYAMMENAFAGGALNLGGDVDVPNGINQESYIQAGELNSNNLLSNNMYTSTNGGRLSAGNRFGPQAVLPNSFAGRTQAAFAQTTDLFGLKGFISETAFQSFNDGFAPYEDIPKLESASWMASPFRAYWDSEMGDSLGLSEFARRFIPKHGQHVNEVNPIRNSLPLWLANSNDLFDIGHGDPYSKIKNGELRLPGAGYESAHPVSFTFPMETQYLGRSLIDQVAILTGNYLENTEDERLERYLKKSVTSSIRDKLGNINRSTFNEREIFNAQSNISGRLDVISGGKGINVHVVSDKTFNEIENTPLPQHAAETNANLIMSKMNYGTVLYYNAETGETKTTDVVANIDKFQEDMSSIMSARGLAMKALQEQGPGIGINMANAYSRIDRLGILSDVSPFSEEFQNTYRQVKAQKKAGLLSRWDQVRLSNIEAQRESRMDRYTFTDYKFNRGTAVSEEEKKYQKYIKDNYNKSERLVGSIWEKLAHLQTPINSKLLNQMSTIEAYERLELYGQPMRSWEDPYGAFIRPYATSALSRDTLGSGALSFGTAGMVFGGPIGAVAGAIGGAAYGAINPGWGTIPGYRQDERELAGQLDRIRYQKAKDLYDATGSEEALQQMQRTLTFQYSHASNVYSVYGAAPRHEKGFIRKFAEAGTLEERERIREILPDYIRPVVEAAWTGNQETYFSKGAEMMDSFETPNENWKGWNAEVATDDIAVKLYDRAGLDAHSAGLGWQKDLRRMKYTPGIPDAFSDTMKEGNIAAEVKNIVQSIVGSAEINVVPTGIPGITVTIS